MNILDRIEKRLAMPGDSETRRTQKVLTVLLMLAGSLFTALSSLNFWVNDLSANGTILVIWAAVILLFALVILAIPRLWATMSALIIILVIIESLLNMVVGGGFQSGLEAAIWMLLGPLLAALILGFRYAVITFLLYVAGVAAAAFLEPYAQSIAPEMALHTRMEIAVNNMITIGLLVTVAILYLLRQVDYYRRRADDLLMNMLPSPIAARLKRRPQVIADSYDAVTVLFADMVGSTPLFAGLEPEEAVDWLNEVFSRFDRLVEKHGLEKIRTIGDNYMVASGVPIAREDHAQAMARFALEMVEHLQKIPPRHGKRMQFRVGMHSGPLVAGVIGTKKYQYDVWGDTVNIASRMESHGEPGKVHISKATYALVKDVLDCEGRGSIDVKGRGMMETWFLMGEKK